MQCNRPHDDPEWIADGGLPRFLCRACNPTPEITPEAKAKFDEALRVSQVREREAERRKSEMRKLRIRIDKIEQKHAWGKHGLDPVTEKVLAGLKAKLAKLEAENGSIA